MSIEILLICLVFLIFCSAFFSASETGIMSINRYRLRHLARSNNRAAKQVCKLLEHPDRLLGVILIGNTFANIAASSIFTVIAVHYFGDLGIAIGTIFLTLLLLIFGEITPKTFAAHYSQKTAFIVVYPLTILLKVLYPVVWFANLVTAGIFRLFGIKKGKLGVDPLSVDELQSVVKEAAGHISPEPQDMLLRVLDLENIQIEEIMVPRNEIMAVDLREEWETIQSKLIHSPHTRVFLYREDINNIESLVHLRSILHLLSEGRLTRETMMEVAEPPYFVPEGTPLAAQLLNFKTQKHRSALVVDEYGDIQGLVTLEDILEEIVGELSIEKSTEHTEEEVKPQEDGSYLVLGSANVRELNREWHWNFSTEGPITLSGLIIECLEALPIRGLSLRVNGYPVEIIEVEGNTVKLAKIYPNLWRLPDQDLHTPGE